MEVLWNVGFTPCLHLKVKEKPKNKKKGDMSLLCPQVPRFFL